MTTTVWQYSFWVYRRTIAFYFSMLATADLIIFSFLLQSIGSIGILLRFGNGQQQRMRRVGGRGKEEWHQNSFEPRWVGIAFWSITWLLFLYLFIICWRWHMDASNRITITHAQCTFNWSQIVDWIVFDNSNDDRETIRWLNVTFASCDNSNCQQ